MSARVGEPEVKDVLSRGRLLYQKQTLITELIIACGIDLVDGQW